MREDDIAAGTEAICRAVLSRFAPRVSPLRIEALIAGGGFSGARIWRIVTEFGDFALRRWPTTRGLPETRILGLHRLLEHIWNEGVTFVAVPLKTNDGTTLPIESGAQWQLEPWMPGVADFHSNPSQERLRAAMMALATWHLAASRFVASEVVAPWFGRHGAAQSPAVLERLSILEGTEQGPISQVERRISADANPAVRDLATQVLDQYRRLRQRIMADLRLVREVTVPLQPVIRDVWHDHVLFTGDEVTGLIDPSACRMESVACDLSRLIGSLVADDAAAWEFALQEYQRIRPLSSAERTLATVFDRSGVVLSGWSWLYPRYSFLVNQDRVVTRLNEILMRMRHITDNDPPSNGKLFLP